MYKNKKIKVYSIIIFSLLVIDFFVNSCEKNLPKESLEPEDYQLLSYVKDVINKKDIGQDIIRLSRKKNQHIHFLARLFLEKLCVFDNDISTRMYETYEKNFLQNKLVVNKQKINLNRLKVILQNFEEINDEDILEKAKNLNVYRYHVYFLDNKRSNYVVNTSSIGKKNIVIAKQMYIKRTDQGKNGYDEYSQTHNIYSSSSIWKKLEDMSKDNIMSSNYSACRYLMLGLQNNVGVILDGGYYHIGYLHYTDQPMKKIELRVNYEDMKHHDASCYFCNDIINNYSFDFDIKELLDVGYIDHVGPLLDYSVLGGIVNYKLDDGLLNCLMKSTIASVWNNRNKFIITTIRGMYYIVKEKCVDIKSLCKVLAINRASIVAVNSGEKKVIMTPLRHPETFVQTVERYYGVDFPKLNNCNFLINYYDCVKINFNVQKNNLKFGSIYPNYNVLDLIENEYNFI